MVRILLLLRGTYRYYRQSESAHSLDELEHMLSSTIASLLPLLVVASTENAHPNPSHRRDLSSVGCQNCCTNHDCSLGFSNTSPGVCCGTHPRSLDAQCCPLGASCVRCGTRFKCTYSRGVTLQGLCTICSDDKPPECYRSYETSSNMMAFLLPMLLLLCCIIGLCMYQRRSFGGDDDVVMVQGTPAGFTPTGQPVYAQPVYGQQAVYAQPVVVQQGCKSMSLVSTWPMSM